MSVATLTTSTTGATTCSTTGAWSQVDEGRGIHDALDQPVCVGVYPAEQGQSVLSLHRTRVTPFACAGTRGSHPTRPWREETNNAHAEAMKQMMLEMDKGVEQVRAKLIELGLGGTHHVLAHNAAAGAAQAIPLGKYDKFQADLLAEFVQKLADTPEPGGSMLDNTIVMYGSSNSQTHVNSDYPLMLVGGENLGLKHGTFHQLSGKTPPLSNLYLTLLNALDVPAMQFSDSSSTFSQIIK